VNNYVTPASNYGTQIEHWNGVDVSVNARLAQGLLLRGGFSTGRTLTDNCQIQTQLPELIATNTTATPLSYCRVVTPFLTQVKGLGSYTIPRIDVQLSGSFQSIPGPQVVGNFNAPNALVAPSLGRPLSGGATTVIVNLVPPATIYGDRLNQLDFRVGRVLRFGRTRSVVGLDVYNVLNASPVLIESTAYAAYRTPQTILLARFFKASLQFDF
jgi:hypothetical protein